MARGNPDYDSPDYSFFTIETPIGDIVAERLGFSRLDNRGRILYLDDFRGGSDRWTFDNSSPGIEPVHVYINGYMVGFHGAIRIDAGGVNGLSYMHNNFLLPVSSRFGIEVSIKPITNFATLQVNMQHVYSSSQKFGAVFQLEGGTGAVRISTATGWVSIATPVSMNYLVNRWISIKLVADFSAGKYVRVMIGNVEYDLSEYSMSATVAGIAGNTQVELFCEEPSEPYIEPVYIGYIIVSGDEP